MDPVRLLAVDIETTPEDFVLGISVHTTASLDPVSPYDCRVFIATAETPSAEEAVLAAFLEYLAAHAGACVTAYNLMGFDLPVLQARCRRYYPLSLEFTRLLRHFSLYDTMIAYWRYAGNRVFCKLLEALQALHGAGHTCFRLECKLVYSGADAYCLWLAERAGQSTRFSQYVTEDSYNHLRLAQILLAQQATDGFWVSRTTPSTRGASVDPVEGRRPAAGVVGSESPLLVRIVRPTPVVVGPDLTPYGPFQPEDVVSLPVEPARVLLEGGFAVAIEVRETAQRLKE